MSAELHISLCPDAETAPCSNADNCNMSCLAMHVHHLEKCTRCVEHLMPNDHGKTCSLNHCRKVYYLWQLRGDLIDCLYQQKLTANTFTFQKIVKQLQVLFELDFENIEYQKKGIQIKRSDISETTATTPNKFTARSTEQLFCFLAIFRAFKTNLESCAMKVDSADLCGTLQTLAQQMEEQASESGSPSS